MTQSGVPISPDVVSLLVKSLQPMTASFGSLGVSVRESSAGNFKIEVDGDRPEILWIRWYSTTESTISEPELAATPYMDSDGALAVDDVHGATMPYTTGDIGLPMGTRWVLAVAWGLYANNATLVHNSGKHEFLLPTTTTSTSTSTSSSTTGSTSTSSSTTESTSTSSSTTGSTSTSSSTTDSTSTSSSTTDSTSTSSSTTDSTSTSSSTTQSTSTSSSTTETSSTTGSTSSTTTGTSSTTTDTTTSSTTQAPSTTSGGPGLVTWTWQETKAGLAWVLTSAKPKGSSPQPPDFRGKKVGDTAHTQMP